MSQEQMLEKASQQAQAARRTKTLYVREEDQAIWDQAREIIGDSLSAYITSHLKTLVATKKAEQQGVKRIIVRLTENNVPQAKAFFGKWLISPDEPYSYDPNRHKDDFETPINGYSVAITSKGQYAVLKFWEPVRDASEGAEEAVPVDYPDGFFSVFPSLDEMACDEDIPKGLLGEIMERQGVEIQELDI